jgi:hypothetical protein
MDLRGGWYLCTSSVLQPNFPQRTALGEPLLPMGDMRRMILPLPVIHQVQHQLAVKLPFGRASQQHLHLIRTRKKRVRITGHMLMPLALTTHLILPHPQALFTILKTGLDRRRHPAHSYQRRQRHMGGSVAQIRLQLPRSHMVVQYQPGVWPMYPPHSNHPHPSEAGYQGPLAPLLDRLPNPAVGRPRSGQKGYLFG